MGDIEEEIIQTQCLSECVCVEKQQLVSPFQILSLSRTDHHSFQDGHNFATYGHAKLKNTAVPQKSFSTVYMNLMGCYMLQLEGVNLKGNVEGLHISASETATFILDSPITFCIQEIQYHTFITATGPVFNPMSASSICK